MTALTIKSNSYLEARRQVETETIKQLPATYQKYALAKQAVKFSDMPKSDGVKKINELYAEVIFNLSWGKKADEFEETEMDRILTCGKCYDLILDKYNSLTTDEVKLAFLNGSLEEYGKFYGLGLKTLSDWLKGYSNDEKKKLAMAEWNKMIDMVSIKEKTPEQKEAIEIDGCLHFWNEYKNSGLIKGFIVPVDRLCAIYYELLSRKGLIIYPKEKLNEFSRKADEIYRKQLEDALKSKESSFSKKQFYGIIETIPDNTNRPIKNIRRKLALLEYFDTLIKENKDLTPLLTPNQS